VTHFILVLPAVMCHMVGYLLVLERVVWLKSLCSAAMCFWTSAGILVFLRFSWLCSVLQSLRQDIAIS